MNLPDSVAPELDRARPSCGRRAPLRRLATAAGVVLAIAVLLAVFAVSTYDRAFPAAPRGASDVKAYDLWAVFHYYLGAKYFPELGYFELYPCALEADRESAGVWNELEAARDLRSYRIGPPASLPPCSRARFTPQRWADFSSDVEFFAARAQPDYFEGVFTDKGFNPPPSWVFLARPLAQAVPLSSGLVTDVVFNLDVAAMLIGLWMIWRASGGIAALLTAALVVFYFGAFGHIGGNFLQYLWFPLLIEAAILWRRRKPAFSGAMLGLAAGVQVFPLVFGAPIVFRGGIHLVRDLLRRHSREPLHGSLREPSGERNRAGLQQEKWRPHARFAGALAATLVACFLAGSLAGRGTGGWREWENKISIHSRYLRGEIFNIGLGNLTAAALSTHHDDGGSYVGDAPNTAMRIDALEHHLPVYYVVCGAVLALWAVAVALAPEDDLFDHSFGLGFLILYALLNLSPYYYLSLALLPFFFWNARRALRLYAIGAAVALEILHAALFPGLNVMTFAYGSHLLAGSAIAAAFLGLAAVSIVSYRREAKARSYS